MKHCFPEIGETRFTAGFWPFADDPVDTRDEPQPAVSDQVRLQTEAMEGG